MISADSDILSLTSKLLLNIFYCENFRFNRLLANDWLEIYLIVIKRIRSDARVRDAIFLKFRKETSLKMLVWLLTENLWRMNVKSFDRRVNVFS